MLATSQSGLVVLHEPVSVLEQERVTLSNSDCQWYALQTQSRHERKVRDRLQAIGIEPLLPVGRQRRQWSDRKVWTTVPLFTGYCFANFALVRNLAVLQTPGVVRIVGTVRPEPIPAEEIAVFQRVASMNPVLEPCDYLTEGAWVEVIHGPLVGLRGQFVRRTSHQGLVIRSSLLQQAALIHIGSDEVAPVG